MTPLRRLFLAPAAVILVLLYGIPLLIIGVYSVLQRGAYGGVEAVFTLASFQRLADSLYLTILARSFLLAATATLRCLVLAFPLAWFISNAGPRKNLYLALVVLPFWTSLLICMYSWMFLLRDTGLVNTLLLSLGWISEPIPLLYNYGAVLLGLVYNYLPFMVLPIYAALERLDPHLVEASSDLGARPWTTFRRVVLPLSAPGVRAGAVLVFIPCLGDYLTPDLLGGGRTIMIANLIHNQFTSSRDYPFGAAVSLALMSVVMLLLWQLQRRDQEPLL
jgi:spermidine/putrescine transport system permease protein